jgi:hypothetical protein
VIETTEFQQQCACAQLAEAREKNFRLHVEHLTACGCIMISVRLTIGIT